MLNDIFDFMKKAVFALIVMLNSMGLNAQTTDSVTNKFNSIPSTPVDVFAKFPDGNFINYLKKNIRYPKDITQNVNGEAAIAFSIDLYGNLINVKLLNSLSPTIDKEILQAFNASPKWIPAKLNGSNTQENFGMRLIITIDSVAKTVKIIENPVKRLAVNGLAVNGLVVNGNSIYLTVSGAPQIPGGPDSLHRYLNKNIIYPVEQQRKKIGGSVLLNFVIEENGSLTDVKAVRSPDAILSEEAVRVMRPFKFINGTQSGHPVRVAYAIEVKFDPDNPGKH